MASFFSYLLSFPLLPISSTSPCLVSSFCPPSSRPQITASSKNPKKLMDFPYVSTQQKKLMIDLVSWVENRLDSQLQPCTLPPDVQYYHNQSGSSQGSLHIRSGTSSSQVDFILGGWLHSELPSGGALNITSLLAFLNASTDAPNFLIEFISSSPTSLILMLDLLPRKDPVLHPDYLQTFYENTRLDSLRQTLEELPEVRPYYSSALYIRCVTSPTSITIQVDTERAGPERMEEIVKDQVDPVAKEALGIWLDQCACGQRNVEEADKACLARRDGVIKNKAIEIDLSSSYPRLFGPDVGNRIIGVIRDVYNG